MSKDTLQLPKTAFSMKANLNSKEPQILEKWEKNKLFENNMTEHSQPTKHQNFFSYFLQVSLLIIGV